MNQPFPEPSLPHFSGFGTEPTKADFMPDTLPDFPDDFMPDLVSGFAAGPDTSPANGIDYFNEAQDGETLPEVPLTTPSDHMPKGQNALKDLRDRYYGASNSFCEAKEILYSSFTLDGSEPTFEQKAFLLSQQKTARQRLQTLAANQNDDLDWDVSVTIQNGGLEGWAFFYPPSGNVPSPTLLDVFNRLKQHNLLYGVDINLVSQILGAGTFFTLVTIAKGAAAVDGVDSKLIDHIPRERPEALPTDNNGSVDFKNLGFYRQISAGDIICEIVPLVPHSSGMAVNGKPLAARVGRPATIPRGKNTQLSEDGTQLTASVDGQVSFQNGLFHVTQVTTIPQNVDISTGNLDVIGDVLIYGDVLSSFSVKATGDITVHGTVEDAMLVSGGNIRIQRGMNGNGTGSLRAREYIYSKFLENCTVWAGLSIQADCIINCNISSFGKVQVTSGKGIIVGGNIVACLSVEAISIGSMSQNHTRLTLGTTAEFLQEKSVLDDKVQTAAAALDELNKNLVFMEKVDNPAPRYQELLVMMRTKRATLNTRFTLLSAKQQQMNRQQSDLSKCFIRCAIIHPTTHLTIGSAQKMVRTTLENCLFMLGPAGIDEKNHLPV